MLLLSLMGLSMNLQMSKDNHLLKADVKLKKLIV